MALNIRDAAILRAAADRLEELIAACRRRGPVYGVDPGLTADVTRKAKGLCTSLGKLREAVDAPDHKPAREEPMAKREDPLYLRVNREPALYELARFVSFGGKRTGDLREKLDELAKRWGKGPVMMAFTELTMADPKTGLTVLKPHVRGLCRQFMGPPPEAPEYAKYWSDRGREPPPEHRPPSEGAVEVKPSPPVEPSPPMVAPVPPAAWRIEPSDEVLAAYERLEEWLLDGQGRPITEQAEQALRYLARALLDVPPKRAYSHLAEEALEVLKMRNGKTEGDDIPEGNAPASDDFQLDVEALLDCLHEGLLAGRGR